MTAAVLAGFSSGALHAVTGPDHLLSLAPLARARHRAAWRLGLSWGAGHALGTLLVAVALALAAHALPLPDVAAVGERLAGVALVGMGLHALARAGRPPASSTAAARGATAVGFVHGATGAAALLLLLPALLAGDAVVQAAFLGAFSVGSALAMAALTAGLARWARLASSPRVAHAAGAASIALGLWWTFGA